MFAQAYQKGVDAAFYKFARVPTAVKQYRRVARGFQEATRSIERGDPHFRAEAGMAHHGTDPQFLPKIIDSRRLVASPEGVNGQHGTGVYWWKGFPHNRYLGSYQSEGILSDLKSLPDKRPTLRNVLGGHANVHAQVTGPNDYRLRTGQRAAPPPDAPLKERLLAKRRGAAPAPEWDPDTAVVDMATRSQDGSLAPLLADAADARIRTVDSGIYQRAREQALANNRFRSTRKEQYLEDSPSKRELVELLKRRRRGEYE